MIKRTLCFSSPAYLSTSKEQLVVEMAETGEVRQVPIEDIGVAILDHPQITLSHTAMRKLLENNVALITCDHKHMPTGLMMPLDGHVHQRARFEAQTEASLPLKKTLWQQTVKAKIENQASLLEKHGIAAGNMRHWAKQVKSGDTENHEARAAAYYWSKLFGEESNFRRERFGEAPNNLLNYAYAILRSVTARSLVGSGLLPTFGIHHRNKYNPYCLADDVMEPYRPFADWLVRELAERVEEMPDELTPDLKRELLALPTLDTLINKEKSPLMIAMQRTTASLAQCYEGTARKIIYPTLPL